MNFLGNLLLGLLQVIQFVALVVFYPIVRTSMPFFKANSHVNGWLIKNIPILGYLLSFWTYCLWFPLFFALFITGYGQVLHFLIEPIASILRDLGYETVLFGGYTVLDALNNVYLPIKWFAEDWEDTINSIFPQFLALCAGFGLINFIFTTWAYGEGGFLHGDQD
ncbi:hypothetical protein [Endozoicomonas atrinae]|uniref:hypothetical protein n=1 Tax=Endozoicomonas atrinae TaxID=1333660 RepID=UPI00082719EE|nr:hypothetical protein [Endozoicomonas atrinae]